MTMKMMIKTRSTSIRGTMFGSDILPLLPPTAIPIVELLYYTELLVRTGRGRRSRRGLTFFLILFGEQAEIVHTGGANFVHGLDDLAVLGASVGADEDGLVNAVGKLVLDGGGD